MRSFIVAFFVLFVGLSQSARADVALLVHGYLGSAGSWEFSGINAVLAGNGWQPAGVILPGPGGPTLPPVFGKSAKKAYTIELPSTAPLMVQSDILVAAVRALKDRHSKEAITLVGHSAGGVVARMALVRGAADGVTRLITIASPHLGTERALQALDATHEGGPFGFVKDVVGPRGCVSIVKDPNEATAGGSDDIDSHTKTNCLRVHHAAIDARNEFVKPDEYISTEDEPDHQALCDREQAYLLRAIREDLDLSDHMADAVSSLRIVLAADESLRKGQVVAL